MSCCRGEYEYIDEDGQTKKKKNPDSLCGGSEKARNLIAFFVFGLINNFAYSVFLSAAVDILPHNWSPSTMVLIEMIPCIIAQGLAPLFIEKIPYVFRVCAISILSFAAFPIVAFFELVEVRILGIVLASLSSGFGEITFMALSSYYHKNTVSLYSSGTGGAGISGSLVYLFLRSVLHLSPKTTLLIIAPLPLLMLLAYLFLLEKVTHSPSLQVVVEETTPITSSGIAAARSLTISDRLFLQVRLAKYTVPLFTVYLAEYLINQAVVPVLLFPNTFFAKYEYLYYQCVYQTGVFISRSSVNFFQIKLLWLIALLQVANLVVMTFAAYFQFIPSIWILFGIILFEGLLGGSIFVNTFYLVSEEVEDELKEFCMSSISFWYSIGILLSGFIGIPLNVWLKSHYDHLHPKPPPAPTPTPVSPSPTPAPTQLKSSETIRRRH